MSETTSEPTLTVNDPVDRETIQLFAQIHEANGLIAEEMLHLELRRVELLSSARQLKAEEKRLWADVLGKRGFTPDTKVRINSSTGMLELVND